LTRRQTCERARAAIQPRRDTDRIGVNVRGAAAEGGSGPNSTRRAGVISDRGWKREFEDPIPLPRGRQLVTLQDAGTYITKLPKAEHTTAEWQVAKEALILVATLGGPTMFARIGVMRALNRHVERVFDPSRKEKHWGRHKLARDR
jgi:hypothetical protein